MAYVSQTPVDQAWSSVQGKQLARAGNRLKGDMVIDGSLTITGDLKQNMLTKMESMPQATFQWPGGRQVKSGIDNSGLMKFGKVTDAEGGLLASNSHTHNQTKSWKCRKPTHKTLTCRLHTRVLRDPMWRNSWSSKRRHTKCGSSLCSLDRVPILPKLMATFKLLSRRVVWSSSRSGPSVGLARHHRAPRPILWTSRRMMRLDCARHYDPDQPVCDISDGCRNCGGKDWIYDDDPNYQRLSSDWSD